METGILIHAVCFMSNHWHGVVSDPFARLPEFLERFHRLFARAQNRVLGRWENLWSSDKPSVVLLVDDQDIIDKIAYTLANPTTAGLVFAPSEWPGVITHNINESRNIEMPDFFFDESGELPEQIELRFQRAPAFQHLDDGEYARILDKAVACLIRHARDNVAAEGRKFLGVKNVLRQNVNASPTTEAPRRNSSPRVAAKNASVRAATLERLKLFWWQYREAWLLWRKGDREIVFPAGTYALRVLACVRCLPAVPD